VVRACVIAIVDLACEIRIGGEQYCSYKQGRSLGEARTRGYGRTVQYQPTGGVEVILSVCLLSTRDAMRCGRRLTLLCSPPTESIGSERIESRGWSGTVRIMLQYLLSANGMDCMIE